MRGRPWLNSSFAPNCHKTTGSEAGALTVAGQRRSFTVFPNILAIAVVSGAAASGCSSDVMESISITSTFIAGKGREVKSRISGCAEEKQTTTGAGSQNGMVTPGRLELPTRSLGNCCSIHLSYGATFRINNLTYTCDLIDHSWSPSGTTAPFHNRQWKLALNEADGCTVSKW